MSEIEIQNDIEFAVVAEWSLRLDLYRPLGKAKVPVVLYLHGGGWQVGDKSDDSKERLAALAANGVAVASANYRLVPDALFPTQIHDVKAAVRWLRANGDLFGLSTERIGIWGASAGAYLGTMAALTEGNEDFEGDVGGNTGQSSRIDVVVHWFGQVDLASNSKRSQLEQKILNEPFEGPFLGLTETTEDPELMRRASPIHYVSPASPPFLVAHGDRDRITPQSESQALHDALVRNDANSTLLLLGGAGHEGAEFDRPDHLALTAAFLKSHLESPEFD